MSPPTLKIIFLRIVKQVVATHVYNNCSKQIQNSWNRCVKILDYVSKKKN